MTSPFVQKDAVFSLWHSPSLPPSTLASSLLLLPSALSSPCPCAQVNVIHPFTFLLLLLLLHLFAPPPLIRCVGSWSPMGSSGILHIQFNIFLHLTTVCLCLRV